MQRALVAALLMAGCGEEEIRLRTGTFGSQAMAASDDGRRVFVVDPMQGALAIVDRAAGRTERIAIEGEPTRIARANGRLFVTLRASREVLVFGEIGAAIEARIPTGSEPFGIVALADRVYVAAGIGQEILEIDAVSLSPLRRWSVPGEPRWLAIHPDGRMLYIASARDGLAYSLDLTDGELRAISLPSRPFRTIFGVDGAFVRRLTGDPTVTPDGRQLLLPALFADNITPIDDQLLAQGWTVTLEPSVLAVQLEESGQPESVAVISLLGERISGYPSSAVVSPRGDSMLVLMETSKAVMIGDPRAEASVAAYRDTGDSEDRIFIGTEHIGFEPRPMNAIESGLGPMAAVYLGSDRAMVYSFLDRTLATIVPSEHMPSEEDLWKPRIARPLSESRATVMDSVLPADAELGRRLFYDGTDERLTVNGLTCALCHLGGRDDGVTWLFTNGPRNTLSLAGEIMQTAPYRWEGERATLVENALNTSRGMSGGRGMTETEAAMVEAFLDRIPSPDPRRKEDEAIARGREIFFRPEVACASCHAGGAYTDNLSHPMFGLAQAQTPSLVGISASAPYFHDGSAATLFDVLMRAKGGAMGDTSTLTDGEMRDLESFLESL